MVIVAGHITVESEHRAAYLNGCVQVVRAARSAPGCLDFAIGADLIDATRINIFERWESQDTLDAFRGSGPDAGQQAAMMSAAVSEYEAQAR